MSDSKLPSLLLVEDDSSTTAALVRLLRTHYVLQTCATAEEAHRFLASGRVPDIIISDYSLPAQSGLEFLASVKNLSPDSVRVLLTGHVVSQELSHALETGTLHRIFLKPWENSLLLLQLQEAYQQRLLMKSTRHLEELSTIDGLTGIFNQRHFMEVLQKEVERAQRHQRSISLILFDIDDFKSINDSQGHLTGNRALMLVADVLKSTLRNIDMTARIGGDEFAAILPDTKSIPAAEISERIRLSILRRASSDGLSLTLSSGVASLSAQPGLKADDFFKTADQALYQAKSRGKNQTVVAASDIEPIE